MDTLSGCSVDEVEKEKKDKARQKQKKYRERKKMKQQLGSEDQINKEEEKQKDRVRAKAYRDRKKQQNESLQQSDSESSTSRRSRLGRRRKRKQRRVHLNMEERLAPPDGPIRESPDTRKRILEFRQQIMNFAVSFCLLCKEKWPDTRKRILEFRQQIMNFAVSFCLLCKEKWPDMKMKGDVCARCSRDRQEIKKFSNDNYMDPGVQPEELKGLSMIEMLLIAQACCVLKVWRLPSGQLKFKGHSIVFPQDISEFVSTLPRLPSELSVVTVRRKFVDGHCDFRIRREKVRVALEWLIKWNPFYKDFIIDLDRLNSLPVDEIVLDGYNNVDDFDIEECVNVDADININVDDEDIEDFLRELEEKNLNPSNSEMMSDVVVQQDEIISQTLNNIKDNNTVPWPPQSLDPLSEFKCNGLFSKCFPTLFPFRNCEFNMLRPFEVTLSEFSTHLMKYYDGRFSTHPSFKYYLLNRIMRAEALSKGGIFYNKKENNVPATVKELKEEISKGNLDTLVQNIVFFGYSSRGSKSFWYQQRKCLISMIDQIKNPTYFVTLSAADRQWPEVDKLIQDMYGQPPSLGVNNINGFPLAPSWLFQKRVEMFFRKILPCILCVKDFWYRTEWQSRGSPHSHGILWCENSPDISQINIEKVRENIQNYFDLWLCTWVFKQDEKEKTKERVLQSNPCERNPLLIDNPELDYIDLASYVQPHKSCSSYCLRKDKKIDKWICKFGFPQELRLRTVLLQEEAQWKLYTERNDCWLNIHNVDLLRVWRANVDLKAIIDKIAVINYLSKYCCKPEILSKTSADLFHILLQNAEDDDKVVSIIQKLIIKLVGQRDFSSQEVFHLLMSWPLWRSSRTFFHLKMYFQQEYVRVGEKPKRSVFSSYLQQYHERDINDENLCGMSLFEYAKNYNRKNEKGIITKRRKEAVVVIYPVLKKEPLTADFCRQFIVLHKPHTSLEELQEGGSWEELYQSWIENFGTTNDDNITNVDDIREDVDEDNNEENIESEQNLTQLQWMAAAGMAPTSSLINKDKLGSRNLDTTYDWSCNAHLIDLISGKCGTMDNDKQLIFPMETSSSNFMEVNEEQQEVLDYVESHLKSRSSEPLKIIVEGEAGTGKSFLIKALYDLIAKYDGQESIVLTGPTGCSSSNINGSTLHSVIAYRPVVGGGLLPLKGVAQKKFQENVRPLKWMVIDEMSMIGQEFFAEVNQRLNDGRPIIDYDFGGLNMILTGDNGQLPCVRDRPLYCFPQTTEEYDKWPLKYSVGLGLIRKFKKRFVLKKIMRQLGSSEEDVKFRGVLKRLRNGNSTLDDWKLLCTRHINNLSSDEINKFKCAPRIFTKNSECEQYNLQRLALEGKPVCKIVSEDFNDCSLYKGTLERTLLLSEGATVMLRQNIWVNAGLVNGSIGTIEKIIYEENDSVNMPKYILVKFACYHGTKLFNDPKVVPIKVQTHYCVDKLGNSASRKQFPLLLAYGLTVHKVQGLTLQKMVIDLGKSEYAAGLSYVGISRIRSLCDLIITGDFPFSRINELWKNSRIKQRRMYEEKMEQLNSTGYVMDFAEISLN